MWNQNAVVMMTAMKMKSVSLLVILEVQSVWMVSKQSECNLALVDQLTGEPENGHTYDIMCHACSIKLHNFALLIRL